MVYNVNTLLGLKSIYICVRLIPKHVEHCVKSMNPIIARAVHYGRASGSYSRRPGLEISRCCFKLGQLLHMSLPPPPPPPLHPHPLRSLLNWKLSTCMAINNDWILRNEQRSSGLKSPRVFAWKCLPSVKCIIIIIIKSAVARLGC